MTYSEIPAKTGVMHFALCELFESYDSDRIDHKRMNDVLQGVWLTLCYSRTFERGEIPDMMNLINDFQRILLDQHYCSHLCPCLIDTDMEEYL